MGQSAAVEGDARRNAVLSPEHLARLRSTDPLMQAARSMRHLTSRPPPRQAPAPAMAARTAEEQAQTMGWHGTPEESQAALAAIRDQRGWER